MILHGETIDGKRRRGGQYMTFQRCVKADFELFDIHEAVFEEAENVEQRRWDIFCQKRERWRSLIQDQRIEAYKKWKKEEHRKYLKRHPGYESMGPHGTTRRACWWEDDEFEAIEKARRRGNINTGRRSRQVFPPMSHTKKKLKEFEMEWRGQRPESYAIMQFRKVQQQADDNKSEKVFDEKFMDRWDGKEYLEQNKDEDNLMLKFLCIGVDLLPIV
jgi:hypothetical protein